MSHLFKEDILEHMLYVVALRKNFLGFEIFKGLTFSDFDYNFFFFSRYPECLDGLIAAFLDKYKLLVDRHLTSQFTFDS